VPRIQWTNLPLPLRDHLFDRLRDRKITVEDLYQLKVWRESEPEAPDGAWVKDFGSFKICGEGNTQRRFCFVVSLRKERSCDCAVALLTLRNTRRRSHEVPPLVHSGSQSPGQTSCSDAACRSNVCGQPDCFAERCQGHVDCIISREFESQRVLRCQLQ
jgi:hypothetical protein